MNNKREETSSTVHKNQEKNSDSEKNTNKIEKTSLKIKLATFIRRISVEPAVFLYCIAMTFNGITTQSLTIRKYCLVQMEYPEDICLNLTNNKTLENQAQSEATNFLFYKTLLENLPTIILAIFIGAWSDKNGRKFLLVFPTITSGIGMIIMIFNAHYLTEMDFNYILLASMPYALGGNIFIVLTGAFSYITDITDKSNLIIRFGFLQAAITCGMPIGTSCGSIVFSKYGYVTVYAVNLMLYIITLLYILIFVKETILPPIDQTLKYTSLFKLTNVKEIVVTVCKQREHNGRFQIILLLITAVISFMHLNVELNVTYLFTRWEFEWDEITYTTYVAFKFAGSLLGLLLVLPLLTLRLQISDLVIGIASALCYVANETIIAVSDQGWILYAATILTVGSGMITTIIRTIMSKIVLPTEQGKLAAVIGAVGAAMPLIGSIMFTQVYNVTRITFSGAMYDTSALLGLIPAICFGWIYVQQMNLYESSRLVEYIDPIFTLISIMFQ
uniref:Major facilitator superfamily (MFS) profile domain-containing protein n=1 Tax=Strigamia maritima TaxID=126957 RepID=T1J6Z0_STRMM